MPVSVSFGFTLPGILLFQSPNPTLFARRSRAVLPLYTSDG